MTTREYLKVLLEKQGYVPVSQAARDLSVSRQCVSQTLQSMLKEGLVKKEGRLFCKPNSIINVPINYKNRQDKLETAKQLILDKVHQQGWIHSGTTKLNVATSIKLKAFHELSGYNVIQHHYAGLYTLMGQKLPDSAPRPDRKQPNSKFAAIREAFTALSKNGPVRYSELVQKAGQSEVLTGAFLRENILYGKVRKVSRGYYAFAEGRSNF
jgi:hypothetical protein